MVERKKRETVPRPRFLDDKGVARAHCEGETGANEWCMPDTVRQAITLLVSDAPDCKQLSTFLALVELDMRQLLFTESNEKCGKGDRLFSRRRFAGSLATNIHELLGFPLGRGRNGAYYRVLTTSFAALGLPASDVRPYAIHGIESATLSSKEEMRQILPTLANPGKRALKAQLLSRRERAKNNRIALRKSLTRKV